MARSAQKYRIVRDILLREICEGVYPPGAQLPSERELATRHEVSHMTARRAVSELVEDNWLERRPPLGTFVRQNRVAARSFNVICPGFDHPLHRQFIAQCVQQIEARGAHAKIVHFGVNDEYAALRALRSGESNLVLLDNRELQGPLCDALVEARERSVLIGNRLDTHNLHCVMTDEIKATRQALDYLKRAGHQHIALVCDDPDTYIERTRIGHWRQAMNAIWTPAQQDDFLVAVRTPRHGDVGKYAYAAMLRFLKTHGGEVSALFTSGIGQVVATLAACRDTGFDVPAKLSLVNGVDNSILEFAHPAVTCVDNALDKQVQCALHLLDVLSNPTSAAPRELFHQIEPQFIERASVLRHSSTPPLRHVQNSSHVAPMRADELQEISS